MGDLPAVTLLPNIVHECDTRFHYDGGTGQTILGTIVVSAAEKDKQDPGIEDPLAGYDRMDNVYGELYYTGSVVVS